MKRILVTICFLALLVFFSQDANAYTNGAKNDSMQNAVNWANSDIRNAGYCAGPYGALWATTLGNSNVYEAKVYVTGDAKTAKIDVVGNVYNCGNGATEAYAVNIRSNTSWYRISGATYLYRGRASGINGQWSVPGTRMQAEVDLMAAGVPINEDEGAKTYNITANMYRCFSSAPYPTNGHCRSENFPIVVVRNGSKKIKYQTKARSYVGTEQNSSWGDASRTIKVKPGQRIYFRHTLENLGDSSTDNISNLVVRANSDYSTAQSRSSELQSYPGSIKRGSGLFAIASPVGSKQMNGSYLTYDVKNSDIGKTLCSRIEFTPAVKNMPQLKDSYQSYDSNSIGYTNYACAYVSYDYDIDSKISLNGSKCADGDSCDQEEEVGTTDIPVPVYVITPSKEKKIRATNWKLTYYVVKPGATSPGKSVVKDKWGNSRNGGFFDYSNSDSDPCKYYTGSAVYSSAEANISKKIEGCKVINSGTISNASGDVRADVNLYGLVNKFNIPEDAEVGTKYCFALSVSPYTIMGSWSQKEQETFSGWHHGKPGCIIVVKKPKAQILSGGLYANEGAYGLTSNRNSRLYGSWVEYELVSNGVNSQVSSNGVFGYPNGATGFAGGTTDSKVYNRLTFANNSKTYGNFGSSIKDLAKQFISKISSVYSSQKETSRSENISVNNSSSDLLFKPSKKVTISASKIGSGTVVVYAPNQEVEITGNIEQVGGVRSLSNIGQMIIIAKNVKVATSVARVDAWILADNLNTCSDTQALRNGVCGNPLEINGAVAIKGSGQSLNLRRTAGADKAGDGIGHPAETFRLNYDAYQWIMNQSQKNGVKITTTYSKEMPVRY